MTRFVLYSPAWGVYLGAQRGLGYWSKLDHLGLRAATTFASAEEVHARVLDWDEPPPAGWEVRPVEADTTQEDRLFASVAALVKVGLPGWDPDVPVRKCRHNRICQNDEDDDADAGVELRPDDKPVVACSHCGQKNRVTRGLDGAVCNACKTRLTHALN